jgi:hypothetical protein
MAYPTNVTSDMVYVGGTEGWIPRSQLYQWSTGAAPTPSPAPAPEPEPTPPTGDTGGEPSGPSPEELWAQQVRSDIEGGYSNYNAQLDAMLNEDLPAQKTAQEGIVGSQYTQGATELGLQKGEGMELLGRERTRTETSQARNLKDIAANLRNAFMAGNVFLGARGAGDSSAANQYSYALTKLGSKQRGDIMTKTGDIMGEIGDREFKLQNIYTSEMGRLSSERDQKIMSIASWFAEAQKQIRGMKASGELQKSTDLANLSKDLLNAALNKLNLAQQEATNKRAALDQWALNNAQNIQQVRTNLQQVSAYKPTLPQATRIAGAPITDASGGFRTPATYYPGGRTTEEERLWA